MNYQILWWVVLRTIGLLSWFPASTTWFLGFEEKLKIEDYFYDFYELKGVLD